MNKLNFFVICFFIFATSFSHSNSLIERDQSCKIQTTKLTVYTKNDSNIVSRSCESEENPYIENSFIYQNQKIIINKYSMDGGKSPQELAAVSIYRNIKKEPVLITLHTQDWCCYPLSQGTVYSVNLYKIKKADSKITLIDITRDLGEESSGLDGENDIGEKLIFKYKNISSIKKWLDKNYK